MGSLRNPVGPLPSSIYWRRRAVLLSVLALMALLIAWVLTSGGGGGDNGADGSNGKNPASSITPGPSGSGPAISEAPGGRDESGDGDTAGPGGTPSAGDGGPGSGDGSGDGSGSGSADGSGAGGAGGSGGGSAAGASGGAVGTGDTLPAGSSLPDCTANAVKLTLRSVRNSYSPDQTPAFRLTARNTSGGDCKVDLGPKATVLTISQATSEDTYWSSAHCPEGPGGLVYRVPAGSSITYTVEWDRRPSAPHCATPSAGSAAAGTYLVEAKPAGFAKVRTSFVLDAD